MSDPSLKCVQWATDKDQKQKYSSQQTQGIFISLIGATYILAPLFFYKKDNLIAAISMAVAGAIAMGTGVPIANQRDDSKAFDAKTQNLLTTGWASIIVPFLFFIYYVMGDEYKRWRAPKVAYNDRLMMSM